MNASLRVKIKYGQGMHPNNVGWRERNREMGRMGERVSKSMEGVCWRCGAFEVIRVGWARKMARGVCRSNASGWFSRRKEVGK